MVIGTTAAILGGAALLGGGISAASSASAANKATDASRDATRENNALAREIYGQNTATLAPFVQQGGAATAYINQLLGIQTPTAQPAPAAPASGGFVGTNNSGLGGTTYGGVVGRPNNGMGLDDVRVSDGLGGVFGNLIRTSLARNGYQFPNETAQMGGTVQATPQLAPGASNQLLDVLRNSSAYKFRMSEGLRNVKADASFGGLLNSGAALKSAFRFVDGTAAQAEDTLFNRLAGQQGVGLSAASAQAGVANNYSSQVQNNNAVNASNIGNAAIARSNATNNYLGGLLNAGAYAFGSRG